MSFDKPVHTPVMADEVLSLVGEVSPSLVVDGTVGAGGHARMMLESLTVSLLVGMDGDAKALDVARDNLSRFGERVRLVHAPYCMIEDVMQEVGYSKAGAVLLDLGLSSMQVDDPARGFSFRADGPLDMRMDQDSDLTAWDVVNSYSRDELEGVIKRYGEERWSSRIAWAIVRAREKAPINTTGELAGIVSRAIPRRFHSRRIDPATRTFQAIRIEVNRELHCLGRFLQVVFRLLEPKGRVVVISFHSLEDRMVKRAFREMEDRGLGRRVTKRPLVPSKDEVTANPRARSAKLRCFEVNG